MTGVARSVAAAARRLAAIYRLDLDLRPEHYVVDPIDARRLLAGPGPRTGVLILEEEGVAWLGLYVDPADRADRDAILEETSHLLCLAWHAAQDRPVSRLILELQGEIDRYVVARLEGRDGLAHFGAVTWDDWMDAATRRLYENAHRRAGRYCRALAGRYPHRRDTPDLLAELRGFYRAPTERKLRLAA